MPWQGSAGKVRLKVTLMNCCRETSTLICKRRAGVSAWAQAWLAEKQLGPSTARTFCTTYGVSCSLNSDANRISAVITPITVTASRQIIHVQCSSSLVRTALRCSSALLARSLVLSTVSTQHHTRPNLCSGFAPIAPEAVCCSRCDSARAYALKRPSLFHLIITLVAPIQSLRHLAAVY